METSIDADLSPLPEEEEAYPFSSKGTILTRSDYFSFLKLENERNFYRQETNLVGEFVGFTCERVWLRKCIHFICHGIRRLCFQGRVYWTSLGRDIDLQPDLLHFSRQLFWKTLWTSGKEPDLGMDPE